MFCMHARQIRRKYVQKTFTSNAETLYSSQYRNVINIANARETVNEGGLGGVEVRTDCACLGIKIRSIQLIPTILYINCCYCTHKSTIHRFLRYLVSVAWRGWGGVREGGGGDRKS